MQTRRIALFTPCTFAMFCGLFATPAVAADASATDFVTKIYDAYKGKNSKGILIETEAALRRYFEPSLVAMIIKDEKAAARRHEVPTLDGDPFIDAQEWEISAIDIAMSDTSAGKATATVNFNNFDQSKKVVLDLIKVKSDWRIADITWQREDDKKETLRGLFRH
jgi:Protein of unknown function (DUF3828)